MVNFDLGFEQNNLLTFKTSSAMSQKSEVLRTELSSHPDVVDVASSEEPFFKQSSLCQFYFSKEQTAATKEDKYHNLINVQWVSPNFFNVIGLKLMQGKWIDESNGVEKFGKPAVAMMNISDAQKYNINIKDDLRRKSNFLIRYLNGYVNDIYTFSVDHKRLPVVYIITTANHRHYYLRLRPTANIERVKEHIRASIAKVNPQEEMPEIYFFNQVVKNMYLDVRQSMFVIGCFALVAIVISLMGVFGIVLFETQHRRREIGIRKVYGATTDNLIIMFVRRYAVIVGICFVVAAPIAWYITSRWLEQFVNRIIMPLWIYPVVLLLIMTITVLIVSLRSWKAANENPVEVL
jgi:putative ABC transport system permease protein